MVDASSIRSKVLGALQRVGTTCVIKRGSGTADDYDVSTGRVTDVELETVGTVSCSPPVSYRHVYKSADTTGKRDTSIVYVMPDVEIKLADTLVLISMEWRVLSVSPYYFQDELVAYEVEITRD